MVRVIHLNFSGIYSRPRIYSHASVVDMHLPAILHIQLLQRLDQSVIPSRFLLPEVLREKADEVVRRRPILCDVRSRIFY